LIIPLWLVERVDPFPCREFVGLQLHCCDLEWVQSY
jgi:hypothetical protein